MPLELKFVRPSDCLSWIRVRSTAYYGPTHDVLHSGAISESSIRAVAEDRQKELAIPNQWHFKVVDTDLEPGEDDPPDNGGRTIAVSAWTYRNPKDGAMIEPLPDEAVVGEIRNNHVLYSPPELRMDALGSLFGPLRDAQIEIMGTTEPFLMLRTLATHPDHRGKGAAKVMLDWGLQRADEMGLVTYLDATTMAKPIYEKRGFVVIKALPWDRRPWGGEGEDWHWCMTRQPQPRS